MASGHKETMLIPPIFRLFVEKLPLHLEYARAPPQEKQANKKVNKNKNTSMTTNFGGISF